MGVLVALRNAAGDGGVGALAGNRVARIVGARFAVIALGHGLALALHVAHTFRRCAHVVLDVARRREGLGRVRTLGRVLVAGVDRARVAVVAQIFAGRADALLAQITFGARISIGAGSVGVRVLATGHVVTRVRRAGILVVAGQDAAQARARGVADVVAGAGIAVVASERDARFEDACADAVAAVLRARVVVVARQLAGFAGLLRTGVADGAGVAIVTRDAVGRRVHTATVGVARVRSARIPVVAVDNRGAYAAVCLFNAGFVFRALVPIVARLPVERGELELTDAAGLIARIGRALIAVVAHFLLARDAGAALTGIADGAGIVVVATLTLGQAEEGAFAGRRVARIDRARVVVVAGDFFAAQTHAVVAVIVLRAGIAVAAGAGRVELVTAADLGVARVDRARVVVVAIDRDAHARTRCLANVAARAFVRIVAGDRFAIRRRDDGLIHAEAGNLRVAPILGARVVVVAVHRRTFAGAGCCALGRLDALVARVAVRARLQTRTRTRISRTVTSITAAGIRRASVFLDESVSSGRTGDRKPQNGCVQKRRRAHCGGFHCQTPSAAMARLQLLSLLTCRTTAVLERAAGFIANFRHFVKNRGGNFG